MNKRTLVTLLIGLNLFLFTALVLTAYQPSSAQAQAVGGASNYMMLTGEVQQDADVLYLFDLANRNIHVIEGRRVGVGASLIYHGGRNLAQDMRR